MKKLLIFGMLTLVACGQQTEQDSISGSSQDGLPEARPTSSDIATAMELVPANQQLAAKYDRSCRSCHSTPDAAAPLTGHKAAWDARYDAKDAEALLASTKNGLNAMPAMGMCNDCTDDELRQLTAFMAGRAN